MVYSSSCALKRLIIKLKIQDDVHLYKYTIFYTECFISAPGHALCIKQTYFILPRTTNIVNDK